MDPCSVIDVKPLTIPGDLLKEFKGDIRFIWHGPILIGIWWPIDTLVSNPALIKKFSNDYKIVLMPKASARNAKNFMIPGDLLKEFKGDMRFIWEDGAFLYGLLWPEALMGNVNLMKKLSINYDFALVPTEVVGQI